MSDVNAKFEEQSIRTVQESVSGAQKPWLLVDPVWFSIVRNRTCASRRH
jgi:hypothetical protein